MPFECGLFGKNLLFDLQVYNCDYMIDVQVLNFCKQVNQFNTCLSVIVTNSLARGYSLLFSGGTSILAIGNSYKVLCFQRAYNVELFIF